MYSASLREFHVENSDKRGFAERLPITEVTDATASPISIQRIPSAFAPPHNESQKCDVTGQNANSLPKFPSAAKELIVFMSKQLRCDQLARAKIAPDISRHWEQL
jgi:hypothetical protein